MKKIIRINDQINLHFDEIKQHIKDGNEVVVQYSEPIYNKELLQSINILCKESTADLCIRFYGHYNTGFDCFNLSYIGNVKNLYLDCLHNVQNFTKIKELVFLENFNIGIFENQEKDFLSWENLYKLKSLGISDIRSGSYELKYLINYINLEILFINGHIKNIDTIGSLNRLSFLSLCIPSKVSIGFINKLQSLKTLNFILGGRASLDEIHNSNIEKLEIVRVKGFSSFNSVCNFSNLKTLLIEDQIQLDNINFLKSMPHLDDLKILNCKSLNNIAGISNLIKLQQLRIYKTNIDFNEFIQQTMPESLKILAFYTTRKKEDEIIRRKLNELGYSDGLSK